MASRAVTLHGCTDGSLDTTFNPGTNNDVNTLALQPDGKLVVGGGFTFVAGQPRAFIARLNADSTLDTGFDPMANSVVFDVLLQPDGMLLVGGFFTMIGGQSRNRIARLNAHGTLDSVFDPDADMLVKAMALQPDGKVVVGGIFTTIVGQPRNRIARLNGDGTLDGTFNPDVSSGVDALALQSDGKLLVGGNFLTIGGQPRNRIARLSTPQAALQSLSLVGYTTGGGVVTWARSGAGPELALPPKLLISLNGISYTLASTMQRVGTGWRSTGFSAPLNTNFYLRTQGQASSGRYNGSSGLIESTRQFYVNSSDAIDGIFFDGFE